MTNVLRSMPLLTWCIVLAISLLVGPVYASQGVPASPDGFDFALIGDLGYTPAQEILQENLLAELNTVELAFVVHDGDIGGATSCRDETFALRLAQFQASTNPFIYTPGDNDWTDCHQTGRGGYDQLERLAKLRAMFFADENSLGERKPSLTRQSAAPPYAKFRENARWRYGDIVFLTVHVVGSNNNVGQTPGSDAEYAERNAANLAWIREGFRQARAGDARAVMIIWQANPGFERPLSDPRRAGFNDVIDLLAEEAVAFGRPVVLVHGDTHYFRVDKPLVSTASGRRIENFTRVETFGQPDHHWLLVTVDYSDPAVFVFKQRIVEQNLVDHSAP